MKEVYSVTRLKDFVEDGMDKIETKRTVKSSENRLFNFDQLREVTPDKIPSAVLARLIDEVRNDEQILTNHAYNRFHNRHNR